MIQFADDSIRVANTTTHEYVTQPHTHTHTSNRCRVAHVWVCVIGEDARARNQKWITAEHVCRRRFIEAPRLRESYVCVHSRDLIAFSLQYTSCCRPDWFAPFQSGVIRVFNSRISCTHTRFGSFLAGTSAKQCSHVWASGERLRVRVRQ